MNVMSSGDSPDRLNKQDPAGNWFLSRESEDGEEVHYTEPKLCAPCGGDPDRGNPFTRYQQEEIPLQPDAAKSHKGDATTLPSPDHTAVSPESSSNQEPWSRISQETFFRKLRRSAGAEPGDRVEALDKQAHLEVATDETGVIRTEAKPLATVLETPKTDLRSKNATITLEKMHRSVSELLEHRVNTILKLEFLERQINSLVTRRIDTDPIVTRVLKELTPPKNLHLERTTVAVNAWFHRFRTLGIMHAVFMMLTTWVIVQSTSSVRDLSVQSYLF